MSDLSWRRWLLALTLAAAALRFSTIGLQSLWYDEFYASLYTGYDLAGVFRIVRDFETSPPVFFYAGWLWAHVFGSGDAALKAFSALLGTVTVPVSAAAIRELASSRRAGLMTGALVASSPLMIWYSQEFRAYALATLLCALGLLFFARLLRRAEPTRRDLVGWTLASILAIGTHYLAGAIVFAEAAWLWRAARSPGRGELTRRRAGIAIGAQALTVAALLPLVSRQAGKTDWIGRTDLWERIRQTAEQFAVGNSAPGAVVVLAVLALGSLGVAGVLRARGQSRASDQKRASMLFGARVAAGLAAVPPALAVAGAFVGQDFLIARNLLFGWVPLAGAIATGFALLERRRLAIAATAALCVISIGLVAEIDSDPALQRIDWARAADLVDTTPVPRVVMVRGGYQANALRHYLRNVRLGRPLSGPVGEYVTVEYEASPGDLCWWGASCSMPDRPFAEPLPVPRGYRLSGTAAGSRFTVRRYRAAAPRRLRIAPPADAFMLEQAPRG